MPPLTATSGGTVSYLNPSVSVPNGGPDTILAALDMTPGKPGYNDIRGAAITGFFTYNTPSCQGAGVGGGSVGLGLAGAAAGSIPGVGGLLKTLLGGFTAHHAAAVKTEQKTLCQAVPDANNFLRGIDAAVAQGQMDTATAAQALEQGFASWLGEVGAILKDTGGKCNAACVYEKCFRAAIEVRKQNWALATSQNAANGQGVLGGVVDAVSKAVSYVGNTLSPSSQPTLTQAGFTPASQSTLAGFVLVGGLLFSVIVISLLNRGGIRK